MVTMTEFPQTELRISFRVSARREVDFRYVIDMATLRDKQPDHGLAAAVGL
jgi:hypothetical protein